MPLADSTTLARLAIEAADFALGVRVRRVVQPRHDSVALELGRSGEWSCLVVDWSAEAGRVQLATELPRPGLKDQRLGLALRRQLQGARLEAITQIDYDRVIHLDFSNCEQLGPERKRTLICELTGRHGNAVLIDEDGDIIEAGKHVTARVNRYRQTQPGLSYVPPPAFDRISPAQATAEVVAERAEDPGDAKLAKWLRTNFHGCSDVFMAEVCRRAGLSPEMPAADMAAERAPRLADALAGIALEAGRPGRSWVYGDDSGQASMAWPTELTHLAEPAIEVVDSLSLAIESIHAAKVMRGQMSALRARIGSAVRQAEKKSRRVMRTRRAAVDRARDAEVDRETGELLMGWMHQIEPGIDEVTLPAFDGSGDVTVRLSPQLSALENAQHYFNRYKKSQRLSKLAPKLLAAARHELDYLTQVETQVELAEDVDDLERIEEELVKQGLAKPRKQQAAPDAKRRKGPRTATTADGFALLYGKNGTENDEVLRAAGPTDLWFHVKGAPGSHVALRTGGRPEDVPETSVYEAALLAARLSSQRRGSKVEVDVAQAKDVRKPKRGRPGLAYYHAERTISVDLT